MTLNTACSEIVLRSVSDLEYHMCMTCTHCLFDACLILSLSKNIQLYHLSPFCICNCYNALKSPVYYTPSDNDSFNQYNGVVFWSVLELGFLE